MGRDDTRDCRFFTISLVFFTFSTMDMYTHKNKITIICVHCIQGMYSSKSKSSPHLLVFLLLRSNHYLNVQCVSFLISSMHVETHIDTMPASFSTNKPKTHTKREHITLFYSLLFFSYQGFLGDQKRKENGYSPRAPRRNTALLKS